jgi:colanic acid biosynthesis glycosyl transferase WcaI
MPAGLPRTTVILLHDAAVAGVSFVLAFWLSRGGHWRPIGSGALQYGALASFLIAAACCYACGLHRRVWSCTSLADLTSIARTSTWAIALLSLFIALAVDRHAEIPGSAPVVQWFVMVVMLSASRLAYRAARDRGQPLEAAQTADEKVPVLIYDCGLLGALFVRAARSTLGQGLQIVGIVDDNDDRRGRTLNDIPVLGQLADLERILMGLAARGVHPRRIIATRAPAEIAAPARAAIDAARRRHGLELQHLPDLLSLCGAPAGAAGTGRGRARPAYLRFRRLADVVLGGAALLVLLPVFGAVALIVLCDVGRPLLVREPRRGRWLQTFALYRFRTMRPASEAAGRTVADRRRTSAVGRWLRRARLDELPRLWNVMLGDLSLIGPRPLLPHELPEPAFERSRMRPGLTGWAQVQGGRSLTSDDELALDLWYVRNASPLVDARILHRTFGPRPARARTRVGGPVRALGLARRSPAAEAFGRLPDAAASAEWQPRLLVVNRYFHPDRSATAQLLTDLVETAVKDGFATTVLAGRQLYHDPGAGLPARGRHAGAEVRRLWSTRSGRFWLPGRALDGASFCWSVFFALLAAARPGDVIMAKTDPPLLSVAAWAAARLKRARLINWCQDLFPETAAAVGVRLAAGASGRALRALRNASLAGAAINVAVCEGMAARLRAEGIPADRVTVIHNWADGARVRPLARERNRLRQQWGLGERFVIGYAGNLGRVHEVETLIDLIDLLADEPELVFLLVGAGAGYARLKRRAGQRRLGNVMLRPYQPLEALRDSLTVPDLHVVSLRPECEGLVMPSKLYGVLAAGRPVLAIGAPAGELARIVRGHDAGLIVPPGEAAAAAAAVRALRADPARLAALGANARAAYERGYSREASLGAWSRCLRALLPAALPAPEAVAAE